MKSEWGDAEIKDLQSKNNWEKTKDNDTVIIRNEMKEVVKLKGFMRESKNRNRRPVEHAFGLEARISLTTWDEVVQKIDLIIPCS